MADNIPQWPFIPAIEGNVPLPKQDPRDKSLAFAKALMATKAAPPPVPMPRPDPRDWASRALPQVNNIENKLPGAIHPDSILQMRGYDPRGGIDTNIYGPKQMEQIIHNNSVGSQRPMGEPAPRQEQDVSNGLFGVSPQHLQQMAAAEKPPDQNLPKIPQFGFTPTLSPMYMNDTHPMSKPPAPNQPPIFWQPG